MITSFFFFISIAQCFPPECENFCPYGRARDSNGCQTCKCKPPSKSMVLFLYTSILKDSFKTFTILFLWKSMITTWRFSCLVKLFISMRHFVLHAYMYTWALEPPGGMLFFAWFFFWRVVQFFQFASNATVYDLLNDHVLWKKNQTNDPQIPNLNTTGSFVNKFSKKIIMLLFCFFWYKIVPWMISLCRTPWNISAD